ncbi:MAG TPA: hypothetical protein VF728_04140 [Nocardioides sp.]
MHLPRTLALLLPLVAVAGCGPGTPSATSSPTPDPVAASSPTSGNTDLEDLPLLAGWPDQEEIGSDGTVTGPARGMKPIEFTACGRTVRIDVTDRVDARISWIEDFRQRAVGRYADESVARAAADEVVSLFDRCPTEPQDALTEVHRVVGDPVAEGGAVVTTSFRYDGADAIGVEGIVVLQRADTLVVSTMSTEGMGQERARELAEEQARQLRPVLAELNGD